jgi:hypothetical protein
MAKQEMMIEKYSLKVDCQQLENVAYYTPLLVTRNIILL